MKALTRGLQCALARAGGQVPQPDRAVSAAGRKKPAVGRVGHRRDEMADMLVQMRFADVPARACREGRERPELAAVSTVPTAVAVGDGIRVRGPV